MTWPWVSRRLFEAVESRALRTEAEVEHANARLADYMEASRTRANIEQAERESLRAENKILIDRIVQMTGQPPIFNPLPTPSLAAPSAEPKPETELPAPETRASFSTVHKAAREAIRSRNADRPSEARL